MPHAADHLDLDSYVAADAGSTGYWGNMRSYAVSLLKAWWGDAATAENDYCFDYLPRITGDHSTYPTVLGQIEGVVKGYFLVGENPAVGSANGRLQRFGLANLDWLVVRDLTMIESATFWKDGPEIESGEMRTEDIDTEVFFLPAAAHVEKSGTFTNTQRLVQWHHQAVDPPGDCRSDLRVLLRAGSADPGQAGRLHRRAGPAAARPGLGLPGGRPRRAGPGGGAARDQRHRPRRRRALVVHRARGRRLDRLRVLDLQRHLCRRGEPVRAPQAGLGAELGGAGVGVGVAGEPAHPLQPGLRGPGREPVERAQEIRVVGRRRRVAGPGRTSPTSLSTGRPTTCPPRTRSGRTRSVAGTRSSCRPTGRRGSTCRPDWPTARCRRTTSRPSLRCRTRSTASSRTPRGRPSTTR